MMDETQKIIRKKISELVTSSEENWFDAEELTKINAKIDVLRDVLYERKQT